MPADGVVEDSDLHVDESMLDLMRVDGPILKSEKLVTPIVQFVLVFNKIGKSLIWLCSSLTIWDSA